MEKEHDLLYQTILQKSIILVFMKKCYVERSVLKFYSKNQSFTGYSQIMERHALR